MSDDLSARTPIEPRRAQIIVLVDRQDEEGTWAAFRFDAATCKVDPKYREPEAWTFGYDADTFRHIPEARVIGYEAEIKAVAPFGKSEIMHVHIGKSPHVALESVLRVEPR